MEIWKPLRNFPGYDGSSEGRIKNVRTQRILKTWPDAKGRTVTCLNKNGHRQRVIVRKAIADTFLGEHPGMGVRHRDRDQANVRLDNLEWCTRSEIVSEQFRSGNRQSPRGTAIRVIETNDIYRSASECARAIGCDRSEIFKCLNGKRKHIKGYHFERV